MFEKFEWYNDKAAIHEQRSSVYGKDFVSCNAWAGGSIGKKITLIVTIHSGILKVTKMFTE